MTAISYREAVAQAMREALDEDPRVFLMGEDIGPYGGAFAVTLADDHRRGFPGFGRRRRQLEEHVIERAGREVRTWMPWLTGARPEPTEDRYPPRAGVARS